MKDIRIASQWHQNDDSYGKNYRYILDYSFSTKKAAKVYENALRQYAYDGHRTPANGLKKSSFKTICEDVNSEKFKTYEYCSAGPSWSCEEFVVSIETIESYAENNDITIKF